MATSRPVAPQVECRGKGWRRVCVGEDDFGVEPSSVIEPRLVLSALSSRECFLEKLFRRRRREKEREREAKVSSIDRKIVRNVFLFPFSFTEISAYNLKWTEFFLSFRKIMQSRRSLVYKIYTWKIYRINYSNGGWLREKRDVSRLEMQIDSNILECWMKRFNGTERKRGGGAKWLSNSFSISRGGGRIDN